MITQHVQSESGPKKHAWRLRLVLAMVGILLLAAFSPAAASEQVFPDLIPLPNGFQPEGIVKGYGVHFYVGSIPTGAIFKGNLRTGTGEVFIPPQTGRNAIGLGFDERTGYLYVAGGPSGGGWVYDGETGETLASFAFTTPPGTFINDVVVTRDAAYFTDSSQPNLYRVPLGPGGRLPDSPSFETIQLGAGFDFEPGQFNANGIDGPLNGRWLIVVNSFFGRLYRVDPATGEAQAIDLGGASVPAGDGILLDGRTLYVVQNRLNQIAVIELNGRATRGELTRTITSPNFRVPTTIDQFGRALYAVNARFGTPPTPDTEYEVVRVPKN